MERIGRYNCEELREEGVLERRGRHNKEKFREEGVVERRFSERWEVMTELKKQMKERPKRKEVLGKKFSNGSRITCEFKHLWKEAESVIRGIKCEMEKVEEKIKLAKKKKSISSLEVKVREKREEIELLEKFREELKKLERL